MSPTGGRMPFGKHKGFLVSDLPDDYLGWLFEQADLHGWLADAVESEYWARFDPPKRPKSDAPGVGSLSPVMLSVCSKIAEAGYRQLALKNHPDQGGDVRSMQAINEAIGVLRGMFGRAER